MYLKLQLLTSWAEVLISFPADHVYNPLQFRTRLSGNDATTSGANICGKSSGKPVIKTSAKEIESSSCEYISLDLSSIIYSKYTGTLTQCAFARAKKSKYQHPIKVCYRICAYGLLLLTQMLDGWLCIINLTLKDTYSQFYQQV